MNFANLNAGLAFRGKRDEDDYEDDEEDDYEDDEEDDFDNFPRVSSVYVALDCKNYDVVRALVFHGVNIDQARDSSTQSPLAWAALKGDVEGVSLMLANGADPNKLDQCNDTSILKMADNEKIVKLLMCASANVNHRCSMNWGLLDFTPTRNSQLEIAKLLVANGANPRARNSDTKESPQYAAFCDGDAKAFLARAERWIKRVKERREGFAHPKPLQAAQLRQV